MAEIPRRRLADARELRALAHPLRTKILELLFLTGPLTATEVADRVGESPANCSWHLRQLAKHGYVEEAPGGTGRQRPWRAVVESRHWSDSGDDAETEIAGDAVTALASQREFDEWRSYRQRSRAEPPEWFDAAFWSQSFAWLTSAELIELRDGITELIMRHVDRVADPSARPDGSRPIRFVAWGIPATPYQEQADRTDRAGE